MKRICAVYLVIFLCCFSSCQAIGDIFKAGVWVGVLVVVAVIAVIIWLVTRGSGKS